MLLRRKIGWEYELTGFWSCWSVRFDLTCERIACQSGVAQTAIQQKSPQRDATCPGMFESLDVVCFILVKHPLQVEDANERRRHFTVLPGHERVSSLQARKDLGPISVGSQAGASIVFGVHCGTLAKCEVDSGEVVLCDLEVGASCRDATLVAVPNTEM